MIALDMIKKKGGRITDKHFSLENGVLTLSIDIGDYDITGKQITAVFEPQAVETVPLTAETVEGVTTVSLPIYSSYIAEGVNFIQLYFRSGTTTLEQSGKMLWVVERSLVATAPGTEEQDLMSYYLAQMVLAIAEADRVVDEAGDIRVELDESTASATAINNTLADPATGTIKLATDANATLAQAIVDAGIAEAAITDPVTGAIALAEAAEDDLTNPTTGAIKLAVDAKEDIEQAIIDNEIVTQTEFNEHKADYVQHKLEYEEQIANIKNSPIQDASSHNPFVKDGMYDGVKIKITDTTSHTNWTGIFPTGGLITDSTNKYEGRNTVKFKHPIGQGSPYAATEFVPVDLSSSDMIELVVYSPDFSPWIQLARIELYSGDTSNYFRVTNVSNTFQWNPKEGMPVDSRWIKIRIPKSAFIATGTPNWNSIYRALIIWSIDSADYGEINLAEINGVAIKRAVVSIDFDDALSSVYYHALPIMQKYNLQGNVFAVSGWIDNFSNAMSTPQLRKLQREGWTVGCHCHTHQPLTTLTLEQVASEFDNCQQILRNKGFVLGSLFIAAPGGAWNAEIHELAKSRFIHTRIDLGVGYSNFPGLYVKDTFVTAYASVLNTTTVNNLKAQVDDLIKRKQWHSFTFHGFKEDSPTTYDYKPSEFELFCAYIAEKRDAGLIDIVTFEDCYFDGKGLDVPNMSKVIIGENNGIKYLNIAGKQ